MIIDTFPAYLDYWAAYQDRPLEDQIAGWAADYLSPWPELLALQVDDYAAQGADWRAVARERVFSFLGERLPAMREAHRNLIARLGPLYDRAQRVLGFELEAAFVLHVGIGCGAGWVTRYQDGPAVLFGLENIAECGWSGVTAIEGLIAHEVGHLAHHHWRTQHSLKNDTGPWWQLYEEGFAQRCEHLIRGTETWHQARADQNWLAWCTAHRGWLAAEFLDAADANAPGEPLSPAVRRFFGSWFDIQGHSETGYYLGHEVIRALEQGLTVHQIALLEDIPGRVRPILEQMASRPQGE